MCATAFFPLLLEWWLHPSSSSCWPWLVSYPDDPHVDTTILHMEAAVEFWCLLHNFSSNFLYNDLNKHLSSTCHVCNIRYQGMTLMEKSTYRSEFVGCGLLVMVLKEITLGTLEWFLYTAMHHKCMSCWKTFSQQYIFIVTFGGYIYRYKRVLFVFFSAICIFILHF